MKKLYVLAAAALMAFAANAATEMEYTDLTSDMYHQWTAADATAQVADVTVWPAYDLNVSTGLPYGDGNVYYLNFADVTEYDVLVAVATEGTPRCLFNRLEDQGYVNVETPRDPDYQTVTDNGDGTTTYTINIKAIVEKMGFAHLHCVKGANWANTTITSLQLGKEVEIDNPISLQGVTVSKNAVFYNILGQRVQAPVHGQIYIVNGRKMTF